MTHRTLRISCVGLLLIVAGLTLPAQTANCALASSQNSADETVLRTLIERYFAAYAQEELDALTRLWSDKSPDLAPAKARLKEFFSRNSQIETRNLGVHQLKIEGDRASALVTVEVSTIDAKTGKSTTGPGTTNRALGFVKEAGEWRVWRDTSVEEGLATRLIAARSDDERKAILDEQPEFVNLALRTALIGQGVALRIKGNFPQALTTFELAQRVAAQINDQTGVAQTWIEIAFLSLIQGNPTLALERYQKAQALCEALSDQGCLAGALTGIGNAQRFKGNTDAGIDYLKKGLALSEQAGDQLRMAAALNSLGAAFDSLNKYVEAVNYYQRGLSVYESIGEKARAAILMSNVGASYNSLGDFDMAIEYLQKSIVANEALGDENSLAGACNNIGTSYSLKGDYSSAMRYFQKGLAIFEAQKDKRSEARNLVNIANVHLAQGNLSLALEYLQRSLALSESFEQKGETVVTLNNIGIVYADQGDFPRALETYKRALSMAEVAKDKSRIARVLTNLGVLHRFQGDYSLALESFQKSLVLREELHEKAGVANSLSSMATVYELQGDHTRAAEYAERAIVLAKETGSRVQLSDSLTKAGNAYRALGQTAKASESFREAISTIEALRADAGGGEQEQQQSFEKNVSPYYSMVELLASQGDAGEALSFAERAKSRVLLDVLRSGKINITKAMTIEEKAQEQRIRAVLVSVNSQFARENRRSQPDQTRLAKLKSELERARLDRQDFQGRLYAAHPELQIQRGEAAQFKPQDAAALGADASTALLEYVVTDDQTYLFVLTRASNNVVADVKVYTVPVKRKELATQVESFREKLASHNLLVREPARQAYDLLLKPAQAQLHGKTQLIIVPDDVLWELPFQALLSESNHYLIEQSAISYAPSLTVLREMIAKRKGHPANGDRGTSLLALGNPALGQETIERARSTRRDEKLDPLPEAEREVQTLARLYGPSQSEVFIGAEAREDRAKTEAGKFRVLHFATHGVVNNASPMYSHLVLSQGDGKEDGLLEAWELLNLDLKADLVVLSACETARGRVGAGEGMIGLSWTLFVAGTPTVVVSQWKVDSASTTDLMLEFHRHRLAENSKAQSLRKAMLKMLGSNQYKHPFYWAPFVVIGDAN